MTGFDLGAPVNEQVRAEVWYRVLMPAVQERVSVRVQGQVTIQVSDRVWVQVLDRMRKVWR